MLVACAALAAPAYAQPDAGDVTVLPVAPSAGSAPLPLADGTVQPGAQASSETPTCSGDNSDGRTQVHGVLSTGIVVGGHMPAMTGESGAISVSGPLGGCDASQGSFGISIGASQINGGGRLPRAGF